MRIAMMLGAGLALVTAGEAGAQAPGAGYPAPGRVVMPGPSMQARPMPRPMPPRPGPQPSRRWGSRISGHWWGGMNAPGGWAAYRAPYRGQRLPGYWIAPRFYVGDWSAYGLRQPPSGYNWARYYDDAVLIDGRGQVDDMVGGLDWDEGGERDMVVRVDDGQRWDRREDDRGPPPPPGVGYREPPIAPDHIGPPPGRMGAPMGERVERRVFLRRGPGGPGGPGGSTWVSPDGSTTVTTTTGGYAGGYAGAGYGGGYAAPVYVHGGGYGGGAVTTVTVQSAPVVTTTTTTEIIEDRVTWSRPVVKRVIHRKRVWRPKPRRCPPAVVGS